MGIDFNENDVIIDMATSGISTVSVAGSSNVVLTFSAGSTAQDPAGHFIFTGTLTGNIDVLWPNGRTRKFSVANTTTGPFTLSLGVNNGSGAPAGLTVPVAQGEVAAFVSDGTNIVIVAGASSSPTFTGTVTMPDGSTWTSSGLTLGGPVTATGRIITGGTYAGVTFSGLTTFPGGTSISSGGALTLGAALAVASGGTGLGSGTSGGVLAYTASGTLASSGVLTANLPVIGGGAGVAPSSGGASGSTTTFATTSGSLTSGHLAKFDGSGNVVDGGQFLLRPLFFSAREPPAIRRASPSRPTFRAPTTNTCSNSMMCFSRPTRRR